MADDEAYEVWKDVIDTHMTADTAATWKYFWDDQEPLSDEEFDLLKDLCYSTGHTPEEHDVLFKLVNRELTLRIKSHREQEISALAV